MKKADNKDEKLNMNLSWKILDETTVIKDSWIDMRASTCQLPGGMVIAPFYVNHLPDFAVVGAVTPEHRVIMVRQYRHGVEKVLLEPRKMGGNITIPIRYTIPGAEGVLTGELQVQDLTNNKVLKSYPLEYLEVDE